MHEESTLHDFVHKADDPTVCGNMLDIADTQGDVPWPIQYVFHVMLHAKSHHLYHANTGISQMTSLHGA